MAEPTSTRQGGSGTEVADGTVRNSTVTDSTSMDGTAMDSTAMDSTEGTTMQEPEAEASQTPGDATSESATESRAVDTGTTSATENRADDEIPEQAQGPVIRDKRRLDPQTGQIRAAYASTDPATGDAAQQPVDQVDIGSVGDGAQASVVELGEHHAALEAARAVADERLLDLQRLQAEYVNYRRRVDRDRDVARESAVASVLEALLPVLDDVHLARQHGDLEGGPFAAIAEKLEATLGRFGLVRYGEPGEPFDPKIHDALLHTAAELAEGTTETTVVQILQPGYRAGERVLRAARVAVADPK